jgi:hypothetical protein
LASDFFDRQDAARRSTARLVVLFILAVLAIVASIYLILAFVFRLPGRGPADGRDRLAAGVRPGAAPARLSSAPGSSSAAGACSRSRSSAAAGAWSPSSSAAG